MIKNNVVQHKPAEPIIDIEATAKMLLAGIMRKHMKWGNTMRTIRELNQVVQFGQELQSGDSLLSMLNIVPQPVAQQPNIESLVVKLAQQVETLTAKVDQLSK
jgi:hypothetical protein